MDNHETPIGFFRLKADEASAPTTRANLHKAIDALSAFASGTDLSFDQFDKATMGEWVVRLLAQGYTPKTIANNVIKRIATLYNKAVDAGLAFPNDTLVTLRNILETTEFPDFDPSAVSKLITVIRSDSHPNPRRRLAKDILILSLLLGGLSFDEIIRFRKDTYKGSDPEILAIIQRNARPRNKYIFALGQSIHTPAQLRRTLQLLLDELLRSARLSLSHTPSDTTFHLWAQAAMTAGIQAADIAAALTARGIKSPIALLVEPSPITAEELEDVRVKVATAITADPFHWYAMHLRPHVGIDQLTARFDETGLRPEAIYYPMQEIMRKVGHRKIFQTRPVIPWLLFFRSRATQLNPLFTRVADLAWGYRLSPDPRSPYAIIPDSQIQRYQFALGTLTPDTPLLPDDKVKFAPGDHLVMLGGAMDGRQAIFISERHNPSPSPGHSKIIFRVRLTEGTHANWIVDWDPRLLRPLP